MQLPVTARPPRAWVTRAALVSGLLAVGLPLGAQASEASVSVKVGAGFATTLNVSGAQPATDQLQLNALAGDDVLIGGGGQDTLDGGPGNNVVIQ